MDPKEIRECVYEFLTYVREIRDHLHSIDTSLHIISSLYDQKGIYKDEN